MKINYLEIEKPVSGRKPKTPKLDHKLISKVGKALYHLDQTREVSIKVRLKDGTSISFNRSEDEDRMDHLKKRYDEDDDE
jgi:hypothetical protein